MGVVVPILKSTLSVIRFVCQMSLLQNFFSVLLPFW
jgi:hypothetical protein